MSISLGGIVNTTPRRKSFDDPKWCNNCFKPSPPDRASQRLLFDGAAVDGVGVMMSFFGGFAEVTTKIR